jgi:hypothetical protein
MLTWKQKKGMRRRKKKKGNGKKGQMSEPGRGLNNLLGWWKEYPRPIVDISISFFLFSFHIYT